MIAPRSRAGQRRPFGGRPRASVTHDRPVVATAVEDSGTLGCELRFHQGIEGASMAEIDLLPGGGPFAWAWSVAGHVDNEPTIVQVKYPRQISIQVAGDGELRSLATALRFAADRLERRVGVAPRIDRERNT